MEFAPRRHFSKNAIIIQEGDFSDVLFVLMKGRVRSFSSDPDGKEVIYNEYKPLEFFGEMSLDGGPRSASVVALEASDCAVISRPFLEDFLRQHPTFAMELITKTIQRARQATQTLRSLALFDVYGRLRLLLDSLPAESVMGQTRRVRRETHANIAKRIGASREMVSKLLKDLEEGGYLKTVGTQWELARLPDRW